MDKGLDLGGPNQQVVRGRLERMGIDHVGRECERERCTQVRFGSEYPSLSDVVAVIDVV